MIITPVIYPKCFLYGSSVYKTNHENSDVDLWQLNSRDDEEELHQKIKDHDPVAMEIAIYHGIPFELNVNRLRTSFSATASNSWVKAKKKLEVEHDYYIGKKSLWHALRILTFGIRLAKSNTIWFTEANKFYDEIVNCPRNDWAYYKAKYQQTYNNLRSEFRKVAPL